MLLILSNLYKKKFINLKIMSRRYIFPIYFGMNYW